MKSSDPYPTRVHKELYKAILALNSVDESANFFRDLFTLPEINEFSNRWAIVKLLVNGEPYASIAKKLNVSTATVTRVAHWLNHGTGGYKLIAHRMYHKVSPHKTRKE